MCYIFTMLSVIVFIIILLYIKKRIFKHYIEHKVIIEASEYSDSLVDRIYNTANDKGILNTINNNTFKRLDGIILEILLEECTL